MGLTLFPTMHGYDVAGILRSNGYVRNQPITNALFPNTRNSFEFPKVTPSGSEISHNPLVSIRNSFVNQVHRRVNLIDFESMSVESVAKFGWTLFTAFVFLIVFCYLFRRFYSYCHFGVYDERATSRVVHGNNNESRCDDHCDNIYMIDIGAGQEQFSWITEDASTSVGCVIPSDFLS